MNSISITDPGVLRLVQELARLEGKSELEVIVEAVSEKLERPRDAGVAGSRKEYWLSVGRRNRHAIPPERRTVDVDSLLYDDSGLPR